jgi:thioredoxin-related protein
MKQLLLTLFVVLGTFAGQAQDKAAEKTTEKGAEIKWMTMDEALALQKKSPKKAKPIFMDVYTDWCGPCKALDKNTFHDPAVVEYINKNYYAVKFNAEGNTEVNYKGKKYSNPNYVADRKGRNAVHEFAFLLKVQAYPTMLVFDKTGEIQAPIVGLHNPEQLLAALQGKQ